MFVHEEGQQAPETPVGLSSCDDSCPVSCHLCWRREPVSNISGKSGTPANLSVALTRATALWHGLDVADALSHAGAVNWCVIKEEDGAREVETGFPSSDDAEESTITRYNATVAGLANLCHCMDTPGFPLPRFHFSQLAHLPFEWPMARLSIDFPSIAASFSSGTNPQWATAHRVMAWNYLWKSCLGGHWSSCVSHCSVLSRHWFCWSVTSISGVAPSWVSGILAESPLHWTGWRVSWLSPHEPK